MRSAVHSFPWQPSPSGTRADDIAQGFGNAGRFERYLRTFGSRILPLLQSRRNRQQLLQPHTQAEREWFYEHHWDTWRWRTAYRAFFSRRTMGRLGRDPSFFDYVDDNVSERLLARTKYALTELDPVENPYLQWILLGRHGPALPHALRAENFQAIRDNLYRLEVRRQSLDDFIVDDSAAPVDRFNLSDVFEYMSPEGYAEALQGLLQRAAPAARLVYWNMMAPRRRPEPLADRLRPLQGLSDALFRQDKAFFYSDFVVEEVI